LKRLARVIALLLGGALLAWAAASIADLKKAVVEIGLLPFKADVPVRYLDRAALQAYVERELEQDYSPAQAAAENDFLYLMGFLDARIDIRALRQRILLENLGGMYNEKRKEMVALEEYRQVELVNSMAMVHELRHAIQDQHFNLAACIGRYSDFDDRQLAPLAAIEGDATLVMIRFMGIDPALLGDFMTPENLLTLSQAQVSPALQQAPAIFKQQLVVPYSAGLAFTQAIFARSGWPGVNAVLKRPPRSSAQVLHPEKYWLQIEPRPVNLAFRPAGYTAAGSGVVGEFYLNVLLAGNGRVSDQAAGWCGDIYAVYKTAGNYALAWKSVWESERVARGFGMAFKAFLAERLHADFTTLAVPGATVFVGHTAAGHVLLALQRDSLFWLRCSDGRVLADLLASGRYE
jgi:hypothetical protein